MFSTYRKQRFGACLFMLSFIAGSAYGQSSPGANQAEIANSPTTAVAEKNLTVQDAGTGELLHIIVGQSLIVHSAIPVRRIYVGSPAILQTLTSGPKEVVVTAKTSGSSSLVIWDIAGKSCLYTVSADIDASGLHSSLKEMFPGSQVQVEGVGSRLVLTGSVPSTEMSEEAAKLAANYSKEIANFLRVVPIHNKQVQLKLRIVEVDRTKLEQFGVNFFKGAGQNVFGTTTQQFNSIGTTNQVPSPGISTVTVSDPLNIFLYNFSNNIGVTVKDLEQKDVIQVLAEPTLTTISGTPAKFLSGGEFPFPVVQGGTGNSTAITIQFRSYGVKVDFTPTVNVDGSIRLKVAPEVSTLDYSNAVTISGFTIPALSTRRAETEVELKDGQSFVVSGLLDHRTTELMSKVPGIANVPILGQLFRSRNNNHSVTELVVIVTVTVVDPLNTPVPVIEPAMPLPNMESHTFDQQLNKSKKPGDTR